MTEDYVLICKACHDAERGWWIPEYEENSDGTAVRCCPHCHTITMFYSNMGKLDLGLLPDIGERASGPTGPFRISDVF
jgi:hypothetical protein